MTWRPIHVVSIHTPSEVRRSGFIDRCRRHGFQSARLHEALPQMLRRSRNTGWFQSARPCKTRLVAAGLEMTFQSARLCEARLFPAHAGLSRITCLFQFTHPFEMRPPEIAPATLAGTFQSARLRETRQSPGERVLPWRKFQSTRPYEARRAGASRPPRPCFNPHPRSATMNLTKETEV